MMEPLELLEENHTINPPTYHANYQCFLHLQDITSQPLLHFTSGDFVHNHTSSFAHCCGNTA
jgi:hypothetical protein